MKVYFYDELREMSIDQLLDLLSNYISLRKDICNLIKIDKENMEYYVQQNLYFYELNILKIKNELGAKVDLKKEASF